MKLKIFWFITFPENPYGPKNIGVTAFSKDHAITLITNEALKGSFIEPMAKEINDNTEVIEDIDIRILDQNHVIPNMGAVTFQGIWYPNLNLDDQ